MWISAYLSIIPFNVNELSATIKRKSEWIDTKPRPINTLFKTLISHLKHTQTEIEGMVKRYYTHVKMKRKLE